MSINIPTLAIMLDEATSPGLVDALLEALAEEQPKASNLQGVEFNNFGTGGLAEFKALRAPLAEKVAAITDDHQIIDHIAKKDKRSGVRSHLGDNPNIPRDVADYILDDQDHVSNTRAFRARYLPVDQLFDRSNFELGWDWGRALDELSDEEIRAGIASVTADYWGYHILRLFDEATGISFARKVSFAEVIADPERRCRALATAMLHCESAEVWDLDNWAPVFNWTPLNPEEETWILQSLTFRTFMCGVQAPADWVLGILRQNPNPLFRQFVVGVASTQAIETPEVMELLTAAELEGKLIKGPESEELQERVAARILDAAAHKTVTEQNAELASNLLTRLFYAKGSTVPVHIYEELFRLNDSDLDQKHHFDLAFDVAIGSKGTPSKEYLQEFLTELGQKGDYIRNSAIRRLTDSYHHRIIMGNQSDTVEWFMMQLADTLEVDTWSSGVYGSSESPLNEKRLYVRRFEERFPNADMATCKLFLTLLTDWEGTYGDLLNTLEATS